jgi:hypothetical protein
MDVINENFSHHCRTYSDIWEHISTLSEYASKCTSVVELGTRGANSTWAFAHGLCQNKNTDSEKRLVAVDLNYSPNLEPLKKACKEVGINFIFIMADDVKITIPPSQIMFVDSFHVYGHLKKELELHAEKIEKYIILHDTTCDWVDGEVIRSGWNPEQISKETGYSIQDITRGLGPALMEFLDTHPEWRILHKYENCNGLTILERVSQ